MLRSVSHAGFTVSNLRVSVEWYTAILGLELIHLQAQDDDFIQAGGNAYIETIIGIPGAAVEWAHLGVPDDLRQGGSTILELVQYQSPHGHRIDLRTNNLGVGHFALLVSDIFSEFERLRAQGVSFRNPPVEITAGRSRGGYACYFSDPDEITLELIQRRPD